MTAILTQIIGLEDGYRGLPLEAELTEAGIAFQRTPGVTVSYKGRPAESFVDQQAAKTVFGRELERGEIGCALAHQACYTNMMSGASEWGLVFEEDARLAAPVETARLVAELPQVVSPTPCIIMLYARQVVADDGAVPMPGKRWLSRLARTPTTASAYFVNRAAAGLLLAHGLPLVSPADWPARAEGDIVFFAIYPWLAAPADDTRVTSSIGEREGGRRPVVRILNRIEAVTGLKFARHRKMYAGARNYVQWELHRRIVHFLARRSPYRVPPGAATLPTAGAAVLATERVFVTRTERTAAAELLTVLAASVGAQEAEPQVTGGDEK